jgi:hypothetical protein
MLRVSNLFGRALRETGQAIDRLGLTIAGNEIFKDTYSRHRPVMNLFDRVFQHLKLHYSYNYEFIYFLYQRPIIAAGVFVAPNASVIGKVLLLNHVSVR